MPDTSARGTVVWSTRPPQWGCDCWRRTQGDESRGVANAARAAVSVWAEDGYHVRLAPVVSPPRPRLRAEETAASTPRRTEAELRDQPRCRALISASRNVEIHRVGVPLCPPRLAPPVRAGPRCKPGCCPTGEHRSARAVHERCSCGSSRGPAMDATQPPGCVSSGCAGRRLGGCLRRADTRQAGVRRQKQPAHTLGRSQARGWWALGHGGCVTRQRAGWSGPQSSRARLRQLEQRRCRSDLITQWATSVRPCSGRAMRPPGRGENKTGFKRHGRSGVQRRYGTGVPPTLVAS